VLADFGLASIILDPDVTDDIIAPVDMQGTIPWMSPELLEPERFGLKHSKFTKASDVYALGMLILEVCSDLL
jgi:serine/threonine protein kinase